MIKVNVMYPYSEGARFDHVYYRDRHMPMVKARLGRACTYYTVEKGLAGRGPGAPPAFVAMCAFICDSVEGYKAAFQEHGAEILGDSHPADQHRREHARSRVTRWRGRGHPRGAQPDEGQRNDRHERPDDRFECQNVSGDLGCHGTTPWLSL